MLNTALALALAAALQSVSAAPSTPAAEPAVQAAAPAAAAVDPWPDDRPLTHLLQNLGRDLVALPSTNSALILAVGGAGTWAAHPFDDRLADWAAQSGSASYTAIGDALGSGWTQVGGALATYAVGKIAHRPQVIHVGGDLIRAQAMNAVLTTTIKYAVDRTRPTGGGHAFPSGHTSAAFASAAVLHGHYGWKTGVPAFAVASFVGWTRVRDRSHWMSDVVFGAAIGTMTGLSVTAGHRQRSWVVVPTAGRSGVGVVVMKIR